MPNHWQTPPVWVTGNTVLQSDLDIVKGNDLAVGWHVIGQHTATANVTTVDFTQIPGPPAYQGLRLVGLGRGGSTALAPSVSLQFSSGTSTAPTYDTSTSYYRALFLAQGGVISNAVTPNATAAAIAAVPGSTAPTGYAGQFVVDIAGHGNTDFVKKAGGWSVLQYDTTTGTARVQLEGSGWNSTAPIRAIRVMSPSGDVFGVNSVVTLLGLRTTSTST